jgi:MFS transporter, ACS family, DAL5 transporter family protein
MGAEKDQSARYTSYAEPTSSEDPEDGAYVARLLDKAYEKKVLKKVDFWLVGFYSLVYIFRGIDSSNYSNAAIINLENGTNIKKQLHFSANEWLGRFPSSHTATCSSNPRTHSF